MEKIRGLTGLLNIFIVEGEDRFSRRSMQILNSGMEKLTGIGIQINLICGLGQDRLWLGRAFYWSGYIL